VTIATITFFAQANSKQSDRFQALREAIPAPVLTPLPHRWPGSAIQPSHAILYGLRSRAPLLEAFFF
jgi:hypothetical protein